MEPGILLLIVFILAPLIEKLLKAGKAQQPPDPRPQQRMPQQRMPQGPRFPRETEDAPVATRPTPEEDMAAGMLPDDLWEILTGERREPRPVPMPRPSESPEYEEDYDEFSDDEAQSLETQYADASSSGQADDTSMRGSREDYVRPLPVRAAPRIVSMEKLEINDRIRHDDFHDRLESMDGPARIRTTRSQYRFADTADLRRTIIMNEILGPPKGLE